MGVRIPGYHLASKRDLRELRHKLKGGGKHRALAEDITLTSLIDMFATIIFFLMNTFGSASDFEFINPAVELPAAEYAQELKRAPVITIMRDKITLEGTPAGDFPAGTDNVEKLEETDWELPKLQAKLLEYKRFFEQVHNAEGVKYPPEVVIQSDRDMEFIYIKRVLFTLTKMGFSDVSMAVRGKVNLISNDPTSP